MHCNQTSTSSLKKPPSSACVSPGRLLVANDDLWRMFSIGFSFSGQTWGDIHQLPSPRSWSCIISNRVTQFFVRYVNVIRHSFIDLSTSQGISPRRKSGKGMKEQRRCTSHCDVFTQYGKHSRSSRKGIKPKVFLIKRRVARTLTDAA